MSTIRFYFSPESLEKHSLHSGGGDNPKVFSRVGPISLVAQVAMDGPYLYTTTDGHEIPHTGLRASVLYMTTLTYHKKLPHGTYSGDGWEAEAELSVAGKTSLLITMSGSDAKKLLEIQFQIISGKLLPSFVDTDIKLTSEEVAAIVRSSTDRNQWHKIVQAAQDTITKTVKHLRMLKP